METARLIISIGVLTFLGWNVLYLISRGRGLCRTERAALSYALGVGCVSLEMLTFFFLGQPLRVSMLLAPWAVVIILNMIRAFREGGAPRDAGALFHGSRAPYRPVDILLACGIAFEVCYAFFRALIKPIESYDAIAIYAIKSKMLFLARAVTADFFLAMKAFFPHPDYPLNIPFIETFLYMTMGSLNDQLVKVIFPLFALAILALLYCAVRRFASRTYALLFTFVLATIPMFGSYAANAYHELPLACYYFASALLLFRWFERPDRTRLLAVSAVMVGLAGWTKNEGMLYCAVNVIVLAAFVAFNYKGMSAKGLIGAAAYPVIIVVLLLPWILVKRSFGITNSDVDLANINPVYIVGQAHKIVPILNEFQKQIFGPKKWNLIWIAALIGFAMQYRSAFTGIRRYVTLSLALAVSGYVVFYMKSNIEVVHFVTKTWARFLLHFLPVAVYWLALILKDDIRI